MRSVPVMKRPARVRRLLAALRAYRPQQVYLFGSYARGEADSLSDLDVVIIKQTTQPFLERLREVGTLLPASMGGVDVLVYTPEEFATMLASGNAFAEMVAQEGRLIYEQHAQG
ncbi:MAG: nucleotidyltransferase domain-containing protein [Candidatus Binatia bacterium]|nr:nucleotidyltransferase domain-containing protein [Candidatus Binatia bacterium]